MPPRPRRCAVSRRSEAVGSGGSRAASAPSDRVAVAVVRGWETGTAGGGDASGAPPGLWMGDVGGTCGGCCAARMGLAARTTTVGEAAARAPPAPSAWSADAFPPVGVGDGDGWCWRLAMIRRRRASRAACRRAIRASSSSGAPPAPVLATEPAVEVVRLLGELPRLGVGCA